MLEIGIHKLKLIANELARLARESNNDVIATYRGCVVRGGSKTKNDVSRSESPKDDNQQIRDMKNNKSD